MGQKLWNFKAPRKTSDSYEATVTQCLGAALCFRKGKKYGFNKTKDKYNEKDHFN